MNNIKVDIEGIARLLEAEFDSVYCDTCRESEGKLNCYRCYRKDMWWGLAEHTALAIATKIAALLEQAA
jgi:hypothetical protein